MSNEEGVVKHLYGSKATIAVTRKGKNFIMRGGYIQDEEIPDYNAMPIRVAIPSDLYTSTLADRLFLANIEMRRADRV